jgi:hypothetical protein
MAIFFLFAVLSASLVTACQAPDRLLGNTPTGVVRRHYEAIEEKDADAFLDTLAPERRDSVWKLLGWELLRRVGDVRFRELTFQVTENDGETAEVQVTGKVRVLVTEMGWCSTHTVVKMDGRWYVYDWVLVED